jgi:hypothetical protein
VLSNTWPDSSWGKLEKCTRVAEARRAKRSSKSAQHGWVEPGVDWLVHLFRDKPKGFLKGTPRPTQLSR